MTPPSVREAASPTGGAGAQWAPSCADRAGRRDGGPAKPGRKGLLSERFPPPCFLRWKGKADSPPSTRAARQVVTARFCGGSRSARIVPPGSQSSFLAALSRPCSRRAGTGLWEARALKTPAPRRKSSLPAFFQESRMARRRRVLARLSLLGKTGKESVLDVRQRTPGGIYPGDEKRLHHLDAQHGAYPL